MLPRPNASEACATALALEHAAHRSSSMPEGAGGLAHTVRATAASVGASLSGVVGRAETFDALRKVGWVGREAGGRVGAGRALRARATTIGFIFGLGRPQRSASMLVDFQKINDRKKVGRKGWGQGDRCTAGARLVCAI